MEGAGVGGSVAEVEGEHFRVGDLAGLRIEAASLEVLGAVGKPVGFGHGGDKYGFGFGRGLVFGGESCF